ncbi:hypothetical protein B7494_g2679 [Chlorociboria aeruginascens]|nr:hypothetical protein B7494_g2679 [Chlorociboria aeruginascens]
MDHLIDTLLILCAGRPAKFLLHRKRTLKLFSALPDPCQGKDADENWADIVGGDICGERRGKESLLKPWKEPQFGIVFRYRLSPSQLPSNSHTISNLPKQNGSVSQSYTRSSCQRDSFQSPTILEYRHSSNIPHTILPSASREHETSFPAAALPANVFGRAKYPLLDLVTACAPRRSIVTANQAENKLTEKQVQFEDKILLPLIRNSAQPCTDVPSNTTTLAGLKEGTSKSVSPLKAYVTQSTTSERWDIPFWILTSSGPPGTLINAAAIPDPQKPIKIVTGNVSRNGISLKNPKASRRTRRAHSEPKVRRSAAIVKFPSMQQPRNNPAKEKRHTDHVVQTRSDEEAVFALLEDENNLDFESTMKVGDNEVAVSGLENEDLNEWDPRWLIETA